MISSLDLILATTSVCNGWAAKMMDMIKGSNIVLSGNHPRKTKNMSTTLQAYQKILKK